MEDLDYKKQILDTKSASFCGAKWYNATIWLGSGMTTSCHHPLPHKINLEEIKTFGVTKIFIHDNYKIESKNITFLRKFVYIRFGKY